MHLLQLLNKKRILFIFIFIFIFYFIKVNSNINNSVIISVGNQPITYLDLIKEMKLISSIQGGPALLPSITSEKGAFVRREKNGKATDSIGTTRKAARTAVGLTGDGGIVLLVVEGSRGKEFSAGATLKELAQLLKEIGCVEALNLDGGTSTTMVVKDPSGQVLTPGSRRGRALDKGYSLLFANEIERKVKSVLAVMPRK